MLLKKIIENKKMRSLVKKEKLKQIIMNKKTSSEERFQAVIKLASLPKNGCSVRLEIDVNYLVGLEFLWGGQVI